MFNQYNNEVPAARIISWGMAAHSFTSFALRASTVGWEEEQVLVSRIDQMEKSRGLRSGLFAGQDYSLNPVLGDLGSVRGRRVLLHGLGNSLEVFLGPGQQATLQNVSDVAMEVQ